MSDDTPYVPDQVEGVPHPRHTMAVFGQSAAEAAFLDAYRDGRLHHAWLITGPRGVGKATLAWRIARFLVAQPSDQGGLLGAPPPPDSLDIADDHPVSSRIAALSEPRLFLMRPTRHPVTGTARREITVDVARALKDFLQMSATDGGWRVVLVDAADQLNVAAANAILKLLEEPPVRTTFLLVSHAPAQLLPTIRSRCRVLTCATLGSADIVRALAGAGLEVDADADALAELAAGSAGDAARLIQEDGIARYGALVQLFGTCPDLDRPHLLELANGVSGAANASQLDLVVGLIDQMLIRLARHGTGHPPPVPAANGETQMLARLAPDAAAGRLWAERQHAVAAKLAHGRAVNLDPSALILDTGLMINETGREILRA